MFLKIGVSGCFFHSDPTRPIFKGKTLLYSEESMLQYLMKEGAIPVILPRAFGKIHVSDLTNDLDGLLLQGGSDVSPESYNEEPIDPKWVGDFERDQYEIELIHEFIKNRKPILGICRGLQILNVALGGTLYQDIETQLKDKLNHRNWDIYDQNFHDISIENGSLIEKIFDINQGRVNSIHHQSVKDLAPGLVVDARAPDGIIEAISSSNIDNEKLFAIQWHPEFQNDEKDLLSAKTLIRYFLDWCRTTNDNSRSHNE